jgi:hypothetical protein
MYVKASVKYEWEKKWQCYGWDSWETEECELKAANGKFFHSWSERKNLLELTVFFSCRLRALHIFTFTFSIPTDQLLYLPTIPAWGLRHRSIPRSCGIGWSKDHRSSKFRLRDLREQMYDQPSGKPPPLQSISHKHLYLLHCARNIPQQLVSSNSSLVTMLQNSYTHIHIHSFSRFNSLYLSVFQDLKPPHLPSLFSFAFISSFCDFGHRVQYLNVRYSK